MSDRKDIIEALREGKKRLSHIAWENALNPGSKELLTLSEKCGEAADLLDQLQRETEPVPLTGSVKIGQVVTGRIVAADAERGTVSIKWEPFATEPKGEANT